MVSLEQRAKWGRMGLCTNCGVLRLDPKYDMCQRCRDQMRDLQIKKKQRKEPKKYKPPREVSPKHKCWNCVWSTFTGDGFYCPRPEGTCIKEKKSND